jgi:hydroxymethylglutaryl-CoA lyase
MSNDGHNTSLSPTEREKVTIWEVGPRDGLQSQKTILSAEQRAELILSLQEAGLTHIETGSFVSPKWVPAMAGSKELYSHLPNSLQQSSWWLVPNERGLEAALETGVRNIAVFSAASNSFCQKNINKSVEQSIESFRGVVEQALKNGLQVRAYVSTVTHCPYEGVIEPETVVPVVDAFLQMGVTEISLGETLGRAVPRDVDRLLDELVPRFGPEKLAGHFHDTFGMAIANTMAALDHGLRSFDSSVAGVGGCPYAPGAAGNCSTEDLVYLLEHSGYQTGVNAEKLQQAADLVRGFLGKVSC